MPTISESLHFNYDGKSSKDFGVIHINLDGGMFDEVFVATRSIVETKVRGNDTPLFHSVEEEPLEFDLPIAFTKRFTDEDVDKVIVWLFQDKYKPLYFEDKPDKVFYCMPVGEARIVHNGLREGYVVVHMRCKSSKIESPVHVTPKYDLSQNTGDYKITIENKGHVEVYPEISIEKVGDGHITIIKNGEIFEIRDLTNAEQIYVNTEKEIIVTDIVGVTRYDNVIGDYHDMVLSLGVNEFTIQGTCKIAFRYKFKYRF